MTHHLLTGGEHGDRKGASGGGAGGEGSAGSGKGRSFGHTELPEKQRRALRRAIRLQWAWLGTAVVVIGLMSLVVGNSQAMKTSLFEDILSLLPPIAFLVAVRTASRKPTRNFPFGFHRAVAVGHLVAAVALFAMGAYLLVESVLNLVTVEKPSIGTVEVFGTPIWLGWCMMLTMAVTAIAPVVFGRLKLPLAETLHNKVLAADADMNKADWMSSLATVIGVFGIGLGFWWADSAAAGLVSLSIISDGVKNVKGAVSALMDARARTYDDEEPHPLVKEIERTVARQPWALEVRSRVRDEGHVFHAEVFVVPRRGRMPDLGELHRAREACVDLDWKVEDIVIVPVEAIPEEQAP